MNFYDIDCQIIKFTFYGDYHYTGTKELFIHVWLENR